MEEEWQLERVREGKGVKEYEREGEALGLPVTPHLMEPVAETNLESVEVATLPSPEKDNVRDTDAE